MRRGVAYGTLLVLALSASPAVAMEPFIPMPRPDDAASVYRVDQYVDGAVITVTAMGTLIPYLMASRIITPRCPCNPEEINSIDREAVGYNNAYADRFSDVLLGFVIAAPPVADIVMRGWTVPLLEDLTVFVEALTVNGALVTAAKYATQRPLPIVYAGKDPAMLEEPGGYRSFYSGHTSITTVTLGVTAMTIGYRTGHWVVPWVVASGVGLGMGFLRVAAGRHFPSDAVVGAAVGSVVGIGIPWLHHRARRASVTLLPDPLNGGLAVVGSF